MKRYKQTRISSLTTILIAILHWIWPPDRCANCHSIYSSPNVDDDYIGAVRSRHSVSQIQRSVDGRFVLSEIKLSTVGKEKVKLNAVTNGEEEIDVDEVDGPTQRRNSNASQKSSSDDGGFLSKRNFITARASWRRPLVASPSQLSLQSAADSARGFLQGLGGLLKIGGGSNNNNSIFNDGAQSGARYQNVYRHHYGQNIYKNLQHHQSPANVYNFDSRPLHINTVSGGLIDSTTPNLYTPSRVSRIFSSSPASTPSNRNQQGLFTSPWAMTTPHQPSHHHTHFSDLSTVYPSSAERSLPTTTANSNFSRYRYYSHEMPSLRTIQEETRRMNQQHHSQQHQQQQHDFLPLQIPSPPSWRNYYHSQLPYHSYRPRTRWYPRHYSRIFGRTQSELLSPLPHLNLTLRSNAGMSGMGLEASPESRSSSSGFGSKNTSNLPHGSHHSGSTSEWRLLPPYRPPPPPPRTSMGENTAYFGTQTLDTAALPQQAQAQEPIHQSYQFYNQNNNSNSPQRAITPPYTMSHWIDMISRLNAATDNVNQQVLKSVDVGSVDGHYEFDPSTPTPSASTPTGGLLREDLNLHIDTLNHPHHHHQSQNQQTILNPLSANVHHTNVMGIPFFSGSATYAGQTHKMRSTMRHDNVEVRLQAMKEEFYAYRKRQAMKNAGVAEVESVC